jgi:hypothetical protein
VFGFPGKAEGAQVLTRAIRLAVMTAVLSSGVVVPIGSVDAAGKPSAPVITTLTKLKAKKNLFNLRVSVDLSEKLTGRTALTEIVDSSGKSCRISGSATSCLITGLKKDAYLKLKARSRNSAGFGPWTRRVGFNMALGSSWILTGYDVNGRRLPGAVSSSALYWKMLGASSKWSKFQALKRSNASSASLSGRLPRALTACVGGSSPATTGDPCVRFNVEGIVGLAMVTSSTSCGTNVECALAVTKEGSTAPLYVAGGDTPAVKDFYTAPNGKAYVVFTSPSRLTVGGALCVLAEVNTDTGLPTCVDSEMTSIQTARTASNSGVVAEPWNGNPPVQFDAAGTVYYLGRGPSDNGFSALTLRASSNGAVRSVVNDNIAVTEFIVLGDGTIILNGHTLSTGQPWVRKVTPSGAITNLVAGSYVYFVRQFADGNVYISSSVSSGSTDIVRYDVSSGKLDDIPWMTTTYGYNLRPTQNDFSRYCIAGARWCSRIVLSTRHVNIGSTRTLGIVTDDSTASSFVTQYYPTVEAWQSVVANVTVIYRAADYLFLAGTNAAGKYMLTAFNTVTNREEIILDGSSEVEIYSMGYVTSSRKLMINGLNLADGKYIVSEVAIP